MANGMIDNIVKKTKNAIDVGVKNTANFTNELITDIIDIFTFERSE